ncbi:MAG: VOC family protein [Phototrophicaceae bacterium]
MIDYTHSVAFTVSDLEQAKRFYTHVLPFEIISEAEVWGEPYERFSGVFGSRLRVARLRLGMQEIRLTQFVTPPHGRAIPRDSKSNDRWFQHVALVVRDMEGAYQWIQEHQVQHVSTAPQTLPSYLSAATGIKAFYFRDPDGHNLELIEFPLGKGDPQWQEDHLERDQQFLGIDHTAIAVASTSQSLAFYHNQLGLQIAGISENYGTEQEHLNMVANARLHITTLRASLGMGVELLQYLAPLNGRAIPSDTEANDVWYWETTLRSDNLEQEFARLKATCEWMLCSEIVELPNQEVYGFTRSFRLRDPDGHAIRIVE